LGRIVAEIVMPTLVTGPGDPPEISLKVSTKAMNGLNVMVEAV
jgi:hypothetical protein